ncbi:MAG: hypothetical protein J0H54_06610 [Rhizobiales bacterium]|nr:hypothetical protein [Hyphomicrobiales bacterium]
MTWLSTSTRTAPDRADRDRHDAPRVIGDEPGLHVVATRPLAHLLDHAVDRRAELAFQIAERRLPVLIAEALPSILVHEIGAVEQDAGARGFAVIVAGKILIDRAAEAILGLVPDRIVAVADGQTIEKRVQRGARRLLAGFRLDPVDIGSHLAEHHPGGDARDGKHQQHRHHDLQPESPGRLHRRCHGSTNFSATLRRRT